MSDTEITSPFYLIPPLDAHDGLMRPLRPSTMVCVSRSEAKPYTVFISSERYPVHRLTEAEWQKVKAKAVRLPLESVGQRVVAWRRSRGYITGTEAIAEYWDAAEDETLERAMKPKPEQDPGTVNAS